MIGQTIRHYTITDKLGAGGMGEVYLAIDTTLDRPVALKFLPPGLSQDEEARQRLIREAKAASKLNHPNVLTIYGVEQSDALDFIVMEYVQGQSLRTALKQDDLAVSQILDIAGQVCDGLAAAHNAEVIHRDIKPENIVLTPDGRVKIMDFGLATWRGASSLTKDGSTVGTIAYMSPEQVQDRKVDRRADLWSLGVVLYELLTRHLPFGGEHEAAIAYSIVNESPEPLERYKAGLPGALQNVVTKLLEKDTGLRYQGAAEVHTDLRRLKLTSSASHTAPSVPGKLVGLAFLAIVMVSALWFLFSHFWTPERRQDLSPGAANQRLVVLPFRNLGDADQDYFADGLTDEISLKIGRIRGLAVLSRTSAIQYKDSTRTASEVGNELDVQFLVEGTVRWQRAGDLSRVRVISRLVSTSDNTEVWSDSYEADIADVFAIQSQIAEQVAEALDLALFDPERREFSSPGTRDVEAYDYFLRANEYFNRGNKSDLRNAEELYQRAATLDSNFAEAYAKLGWTHAKIYWKEVDPTPERLEMAKAAIDRALTLQPGLPEGHLAMGYFYYWGSLDYGRALLEFTAALEDDPNNSDLLEAIGYIQRRLGHFDEALVYLKKSLTLDPRSSEKTAEIGNTYYRLRQWSDAETHFRRALSLAPDYASAYKWLARTYVYRSADIAGAHQALEDGARHLGAGSLTEERSWLAFLAGDYDVTLRYTEITDGDTTFYYLEAARIYAAMDHDSRASAYFDSARVNLEGFIRSEPEVSSLHRSLAIAYAGLGRGDDALREAMEAQRLAPISKDAFYNGPKGVEVLAQVHAALGNEDAALDQIEHLLSLPAGLISVPYLKIAPEFASLRGHPRFQHILASRAAS